MRPIVTVLIFLALVFLFGALIAPWLYWGAQNAAQSIPFLQGLAHQPFHRFVSRSLLGMAIIGLWPMARRLQIGSWSELGLRQSRKAKRQFYEGLLLGVASLAFVAGLALAGGVRRW